MASLIDPELRAALALTEVPGLGTLRFRRLVDRHGSARAALEAVRDGFALPGYPKRTVKALRRIRPAGDERFEALGRKDLRVVSYGQEAYPERLLQLERPPPVLFLRGPLDLPSTDVVTIVGTRAATAYGRRMAGDLARDFARAGWTVVSGLALGVDGAAHRGALAAGGATAGVVGHGHDHVYPRGHRRLFDRMAEVGLVASEFAPHERPHARHFPRRNRILAALGEATVVVQAGAESGARITADLALDLGREVFAVPGPVGPEASVGVHDLLRSGAAPATCAEDVIGALRSSTEHARREAGGVSRDRLARIFGPGAAEAAAVCRSLAGGARTTDALVAGGAVAAGRAPGLLSRLELEEVLRRLPGDRWELHPDWSGETGTSVPAGA